MKKTYLHFFKGFTIIETIVSIAIIMTAIAGPMTASQRGLNAAAGAKDHFVAQYLIQDAVEYFYYLRDRGVMDHGDWLHFVPSNMCAPGCVIDIYRSELEHIHGPYQPRLYTTTDGFYTHRASGNRISQFERRIDIQQVSSDVIVLKVTVSWIDSRGVIDQTILEKTVFNR